MSSKKLLLIEPFTALPQSSGGKTRIFHTISELTKYFDLTIWSFFVNNQELSLQENWLKKINLPYQHFITQKKKFLSFISNGQPYWFSDWWNKDLTKVLKNKAANFDSIQIESTQLLYLVNSLTKSNHKIFIAYDISSISFWRRLRSEKNLFKKLLHFFRFVEVYLYELRYLPLFDLVIAMSETDKINLKKLFHLRNVEVIENGISEINFLPMQKEGNSINLGLVGSFSHPPNLEAFRFCCEQILPLLEENQVKFKFYLAGENNHELIENIANKFLKDPRQVINFGFIKDIKDFYQQIDFLIAPLFAGSGTRIKILESLSFGRPVLTTKVGAEGINIVSPFLQIIPNEKEKDIISWLQMILNIAKFKLSKNDQENLIKELSKLTWLSLMKKSLFLL